MLVCTDCSIRLRATFSYSPDFKIFAAISSLNEVILAGPFSCHPLVGGAFFRPLIGANVIAAEFAE